MRLGFIGTGTMGNPMARCLIEAGHHLTVHDVRREATTNLCEMGAQWADNPRAVAEQSEVVFTSLPGPAQMKSVLLDPVLGVLAGLSPGNGYIDMTTNSPTVFRGVAEECKARGVEVLDAPVSGRPPSMTIWPGATPRHSQNTAPCLSAWPATSSIWAITALDASPSWSPNTWDIPTS